MNNLKRRHFLQLSAGLLTAIGLNQLTIQKQGLKYAKVLAQDTPRKLALLVGINGYPAPNDLQGCVNDVYLQRELLIHRFGFKKEDILLVTDAEGALPTRNNILTAFEEHLINQAKENDVVVFHFSGHGSQVIDKTEKDNYNSTFVPIDAEFKVTDPAQNKTEVNDIMGHTLFLLMSAIKTDNFTAVLDCCHAGGGTRGNIKIRAFRQSSGLQVYPSQIELDYQQQWLSKLGIDQQTFIKLYQDKIAKGMVLASAQETELAADGTSLGYYSTGAFTYALTQYLWQFTGYDPISQVMRGVALGTTRISPTGQNPLYEVYQESYHQKPIYFLKSSTPNAEGIVKKVNGNQVELWLGGFNPQALNGASQNAIFKVINAEGKAKGEVIVQNRNGLTATAISNPENPIQQVTEGDFIQEKAIAIPEDFALYLGLEQSLQKYQSELANIDDRIKIVSLNKNEPVDYILGEMTQEIVAQVTAQRGQKNYTDLKQIPTVGSRGLYNPALEIVPDSFGEVGEDITKLKERLIPKLRSFLGIKLVQTLFTGQGNLTNSNRLKISAEMTVKTSRGEVILSSNQGISQPNLLQTEGTIPLLTVGTPTQFKITNNESQPLYIALLVIDHVGDLSIVFPDPSNTAENIAIFAGGESFMFDKNFQKVPQTTDEISITEPLGTTELFVIASREPIHKPLKALKELMSAKQRSSARGALDIMGDFVRDTRGYGNSSDRSLSVDQVGSASITFKTISP